METVCVDSLDWRPADARPPGTAVGRRPVPAAVEVIWGASFATELRRIGTELVELANEATRVTVAAEEAERRARAEGVHGETSRTMAIQLHRFLAELRIEAEEEALALVKAARCEARLALRHGEARDWAVDARVAHWRALLGERAARASSSAPEVEVSWSAAALAPGPVLAPPEPVPVPVARSWEDELFAPENVDDVDEPVAVGDATEFWADRERPVRWPRVRRHLTLASVLRGSAVLCVGVALALQVS